MKLKYGLLILVMGAVIGSMTTYSFIKKPQKRNQDTSHLRTSPATFQSTQQEPRSTKTEKKTIRATNTSEQERLWQKIRNSSNKELIHYLFYIDSALSMKPLLQNEGTLEIFAESEEVDFALFLERMSLSEEELPLVQSEMEQFLKEGISAMKNQIEALASLKNTPEGIALLTEVSNAEKNVKDLDNFVRKRINKDLNPDDTFYSTEESFSNETLDILKTFENPQFIQKIKNVLSPESNLKFEGYLEDRALANTESKATKRLNEVTLQTELSEEQRNNLFNQFIENPEIEVQALEDILTKEQIQLLIEK